MEKCFIPNPAMLHLMKPYQAEFHQPSAGANIILDTKFLQHLAEMHPVSALHELTHRLGWPGPNITLAFDCGPPFAKMYIFKAQVNGQVFQNTVAVNDVKIAKQNVAWLALQEMGFVKPDPANPV